MSEEKQPDGEEPKIVVDEDWKSQAQAEKRKLAEKVEEPGPAEGQAGTPEPGEQGRPTLPAASFSVLVSSLVTQALFALGAIEEPRTKKRYRDLAMAKHNIDMLSVLEDKTKGNLTEQEKGMLDEALYQVRMAYVQSAQGGGG